MNELRSANAPSGAKLLNESKANPASVNMDIFAKKTARDGAATGQGTVNSNYLQETREQNPDPAQDQKEKPQVSLSNCKFATPVAELKLNEEFEFSVEVKKIGQPKSLKATFDLYATRKREGKEQRDKIWSGKEGTPVDAKAEPVVLKGKDVLATQADYVLGELVTFELEAIHSEAGQSAKSGKVDVSLKTVAHWVGGDDLFFRTDGEFPLLGSDGSLIGVLVAAVGRVKKPGQDGETAICFGFASSAGETDNNRKLSLRRAQAVKALLDRDEAAWVELAKAHFETADIQQFLSDLHAACGWECDPGAVDGQAGPKTKSAIESFQNECNTRYNLGLKSDGVCGPKTWAAVHRAILGQVQVAMDEDASKAPAWPKAKWGNKGKGVHANGEDFATGGDKPEERSVQITFFAPGSEPPLKEVADGQKPSPEHNPVQQPDRMEKKKVEKTGEVKKESPASEPFECTCILRCPELPGASVHKDIHGLWLHLIDQEDAVLSAKADRGSLKDASNQRLKINPGKSYKVFLSHQQESLPKDKLSEIRNIAISVTGKEWSGKEATLDIWSQGDFILCEPKSNTSAIRPFLAELPATYVVGYVGLDEEKKRGIYSYPREPNSRKPEEYRGGGVFPLIEWRTSNGIVHLATRYHPTSKNLKILLAASTNPKNAFTTLNTLGSSGNIRFPDHHRYKGDLVDALSVAASTRNPSKLPNPPSTCCLPGDIIWQTQGRTNHCGAYSFSAMMNYWHPDYPENLGKDWAERIGSIVPFYNDAARVPGHLVDAANKNSLKSWLLDEETIQNEAAALKTLKLWIQAGVPVIVLVNEAPGKFGLHWKVAVGYDADRIFFNNSGGDLDHGRPVTSTPDYFHAPTGNDVDSTTDFLMKWREASVPLVAHKYTMLPMIPTDPRYRGGSSR